MSRQYTIPFVLAVASWVTTCAQAQVYAEAKAGYVFDTNLSRAQRMSDIKSDAAMNISANIGRAFDVGVNTVGTLGLQVGSTSQMRYAGLSHNDLGASVSLRRKLGLGPYAPWIRASFGATRAIYRDPIRSGWIYDAALAVGKRHSMSWDSLLEVRHDRRTTDSERRVVANFSGAVYEVSGWTGAASTNLDINDRLRLSAGYALRDGDITSTATHTQSIWDASTAWNKDAGLRGDSYRIHARTHIATLGASIALGPDASFNVGIERWLSRANGGFDYYNTLVLANFMFRLR